MDLVHKIDIFVHLHYDKVYLTCLKTIYFIVFNKYRCLQTPVPFVYSDDNIKDLILAL